MSAHLIMDPIKDVFLIRLAGFCRCSRDLSEQIKKVTKDVHVRAENTELMLSFQRGQVTLQQYKVPESRPTGVTFTLSHILTGDNPPPPSCLQLLLCSLYEIYLALEEEMDRNCDHPSVAPIYFPAELARLAAIEKDLEFFFGQDWREKIVVPAATRRYCHRIRQVRSPASQPLLPDSE